MVLAERDGNFSPYQLARWFAAGNGRANGGELIRLEIHRGLPSQKRDTRGYAANRRQAAAWMKENQEIIIPRLRPLRYPRDPNVPPTEKGVDVELALAAAEWTLTERCDVAVIVSHDSDLLPAVELIGRLKGPERVETASWKSPSFNSRLKQRPGVFHHFVPEQVFRRVETPINYAHPA